jgi:hypothetical protein
VRTFGKAVLPMLVVVALLVIGHPSSSWATATVPEIDPSSGLSALTLLAGAVVVIRSWRTK